jgi:hypothetical protein
MKLKINVERVVDKENDTVLEWFAITEPHESPHF